MYYWCHIHCCVQHALYFKLLKFVFPYFSQLLLFNTLSAGIEVSIKSASMFSLKANRGSVCYNLLVAEHAFVSTGCGTDLYHLSPTIFTVTSLQTLRIPYHYVYAVSSNCSHICSFQHFCRTTFGIQCFISKSNHPFLGLSLTLSFESHRHVSLSIMSRAPSFQCIILLHHIRLTSSASTDPMSCFQPL